MINTIKILEANTLEALFTCSVEESELAYKKAEEFEEMGLDIKLEIPSVAETLITSLGASIETVQILKDEMDEEVASHIEGKNTCGGCA